ncbi:PH domain-containing protein [Leptospira sp. 2 VSF19]|uniref:PH domain-containing protein n=1 Tax=Leptospira soteropolitanensis TaxID=2950025 RepID=A0AAW5VAH9_9LEPT|nr:PH domain-containing protein [Leptospira soteropolitanensis]MCW7491252.1 PH domain-containing protein [Leptospira soteropolitanensis]MCW7498837.1 PH domain-containing protein [Leptospira soteropolitanensis]MCW7521571.1 PH domain-containing protein [Leptospira soteropolitanensis]MCW7524940.1 PH domain-containing protein [Leptospira soteropolitanensis]MCW7528808.1 PH domain-containing protein [Leptospira soteropolitanensis]
MPTMDQIKTQLQGLLKNHPNVNIDILIAYHPAFTCLPEILEDEELIQGYCMGLLESKKQKMGAGKWIVLLTNKRFYFIRKLMFRSKFDSIPIELPDIKKLTPKMGWFFGKIQWETEDDTIQMLQIGKKDYEFFLPCLEGFL